MCSHQTCVMVSVKHVCDRELTAFIAVSCVRRLATPTAREGKGEGGRERHEIMVRVASTTYEPRNIFCNTNDTLEA